MTPYDQQTGWSSLQKRQSALDAQTQRFMRRGKNDSYARARNWVDVYDQTPTGTGDSWDTQGLYLTLQTATSSSASTVTISNIPTIAWVTTSSDNDYAHRVAQSNVINIPDGMERKINLPDGSIIDVKKDGSYEIVDKDAKVTYRACRIRDFNQYLNVSDRLEEFIAFCGEQGVRKGEMLELPLSLFIGWLVLQAAKADKEPEPDIPLLPDLRKRITPRCPSCGRFTLADMRAKRIEFCAPACFERHYQRHLNPRPSLEPLNLVDRETRLLPIEKEVWAETGAEAA